MTVIKASAIINAIEGAVIVTVTPSANGLNTRDLQFFRGLSNQICKNLQKSESTHPVNNSFVSKNPEWLSDNLHKEFWVVRLIQIPLKEADNAWLGVDLYFADGVRGYTLKQVTCFVNNSRSLRENIPAANLNTRNLIDAISETLSSFVDVLYRNYSGPSQVGNAPSDEIVSSLKNIVASWNDRRNAPYWRVESQAGKIHVQYSYTFQQGTCTDQWVNNPTLRSAGDSFDVLIAEAKRLNSKIQVQVADKLTKQKCQKIDTNPNISDEGEQTLSGLLILKPNL